MRAPETRRACRSPWHNRRRWRDTRYRSAATNRRRLAPSDPLGWADGGVAAVELARSLRELGFDLAATRGTAAALEAAGIAVTPVKKVHEGRPHVVDMIKNGDIAMLINTTEGRQAIGDSYTLRRAALMAKLPYYTTLPGARAVVQALARVRTGELEVAPLQSYFAHSH